MVVVQLNSSLFTRYTVITCVTTQYVYGYTFLVCYFIITVFILLLIYYIKYIILIRKCKSVVKRSDVGQPVQHSYNFRNYDYRT